jgi:opacity protein-like surface antigen
MNTSIKKTMLAIAFAVLSAFFPMQSFASIFVRGAVWQTNHTDSELNSSFGPDLAVGGVFGTALHHEVSLEVSKYKWEWSRPSQTAGIGWTGSGDAKSLLASYRYYFGKPESLVRFYLGGSVGQTKIDGDLLFNGSGVQWIGKADKIQPVFGGTVGISCRLGSRASCELGYRYSEIRGFDATVSLFGTGPLTRQIDFPKTSAHILTAGLSVSF